MPPLAVVLFLTGIAVWANGLYFLGVGADRKEGGTDPLKAVGWITLVAGLSNFTQVFFTLGGSDPIILNQIAGLVVFYAAFFTFLGIVEILGLDLRVIGNVAVAVALVPFLYYLRGPGGAFEGFWMFRTILIFWGVVFLALAATTYGRFNPKAMGLMLLATAGYTFWVPAGYLALNLTIP